MPMTVECFDRCDRLAIFTDGDATCATQIVFVHAPGPDVGTWMIEYIRSSRTIQGQHAVDANDLTPLSAFGLRGEFNRQASILVMRPCDVGDLPTACYKDGRPRKWQGRLLVGVHPNLIEPLDVLYS